MKQNVIIELANDDLLERLEAEEKQLTRLKLNHAVSPLENPNKIVDYRRTIARLKTEIRKRKLQGKL
ncbi:MAG: 50S ribosomal protein L29 [Bacteroidales bacterium]|jgi:large subunit ribosomal protein L29|nr:50S ribosomal protein L29 [Bacteroidales bacterium]NCU37250.1 50S ribosomal protein L29 [Candidatus Falkowbacteria bacterium]MDD2630941.1 50S ribosomal protein L29 [Bacteroidales bacterium]MDD3131200.1 50S ribosomal protein L29 [Bacteroidales bacterium]MDD3525368.1 50S ribosomal protein L29 [Bacteroidales bacterium]